MAEYRFVTVWRIEAPLQRVFDAISDSLRWPQWWPGVQAVEEDTAGNADGIGSVRRYRWRSRLSYRICFAARTTRVEPPNLLEATVRGDLEGRGRWSFAHRDGVTSVRYDWQVRTTKRWMNLFSPIARPLFSANHHALMRQGAEGLARLLDARLLQVWQDDPPVRKMPERVNWMAGAAAGVAAGIVATAAQMVLWWIASYALPETLFRDARLAAAIALGPSVLPPPASFDWRVFSVATLVHFALSIAYGLLLAPLLARLPIRSALASGAVYGILLYGINMYGFTALFPWFVASRDWVTAVTHLIFGTALAAIYKTWDTDPPAFAPQWDG